MQRGNFDNIQKNLILVIRECNHQSREINSELLVSLDGGGGKIKVFGKLGFSKSLY